MGCEVFVAALLAGSLNAVCGQQLTLAKASRYHHNGYT
jgi:hypothetical protein